MSEDRRLGTSRRREIDSDALLVGEFVAERLHRRRDAQQIRALMNAARGRALECPSRFPSTRFCSLLICASLEHSHWTRRELRELDCQQREPLADIIVKLSRDPRPLLLLCLDQPAAQAGERSFGALLHGDVMGDLRNPHQCARRVGQRGNGQRDFHPRRLFSSPESTCDARFGLRLSAVAEAGSPRPAARAGRAWWPAVPRLRLR